MLFGKTNKYALGNENVIDAHVYQIGSEVAKIFLVVKYGSNRTIT